jgi:hypothetical protein
VREPFVCAGCGLVDALADGLCADCAARDAKILDLDPDAPIPFALTPRAYAVLDVAPASETRAAASRPQTASQGQHAVSGEAACPRCGRVRGMVFDGERTRCFACHRHRIPELPPIVA